MSNQHWVVVTQSEPKLMTSAGNEARENTGQLQARENEPLESAGKRGARKGGKLYKTVRLF